jgi:predicted transposase YdaD
LIEFIETIVIYKLPRLSREEIQAMLEVHDLRHTRVYQEGVEEGVKEGEKKGLARAIVKLAAKPMSAEEIAATLEVELDFVRQVLTAQDNG